MRPRGAPDRVRKRHPGPSLTLVTLAVLFTASFRLTITAAGRFPNQLAEYWLKVADCQPLQVDADKQTAPGARTKSADSAARATTMAPLAATSAGTCATETRPNQSRRH